MSSNLATKQDLQGVRQEVLGVRQELQHLLQLMNARFEAVDGKFEALDTHISLTLQNQESRIVVKLGVLMTVLFGLAGTLLALFH